MALEFLSGFFLQPWGLLALLAIIPLVVIYLKKPKPKKLFFPSIEFLMKRNKKKITSSWLSRILDDPLFLLQLLILALLGLAAAYPYALVNQTIAAQDALIVLDASGSMQTASEGTTRFEKAKELAIQSLGTTNTVILAEDYPQVLAENAGRGEAERLIRAARPKATTTNLYDAMILGDNYLAAHGGKVVVVSDFLHNANSKSLATARNVLQSKGIVVQYKSVAGHADNLGIVSVKVDSKNVQVKIRNYQNRKADIQVAYGNQSKQVSMAGLESQTLAFVSQPGKGQVKMTPSDDMPLDNTAYVEVPDSGTVRALLLTNQESRYLPAAFDLIDGVKLDRATLPVVQSLDYDLFIFQNVDKAKLLPGTIKDIADRAQNGASAMIVSQPDMPSLGLDRAFGFSIGKRLTTPAAVGKIDSTLTDGIDFGTASQYFNVSGFDPVAYVQADSAVTVVGKKNFGKGSVLYMGLEDSQSSFHFELMYPVFWKRTLERFFGKLGTEDVNFNTGSILSLNDVTPITRPDGSVIQAKSIALDEAGFYQAGEKTIAVNMASEQESDVNGLLKPADPDVSQAKNQDRKVPSDMTPYLALAGILLVLAELAYIKYRGDI